QRYAAMQYQGLRDACTEARKAQHTILQWNQAVVSTLFAAALVAGTSSSDKFVIAAQFIFGVVIPAVLLGGALAWAGEMIRMETIGMFLRSFERAAWDRGQDGLTGTSFLVWENFLWSPPAQLDGSGYRKQNTGYAGVALFFIIMYAASMIAFCVLSSWWLSLVTCAALTVLGAVTMIPSAIQIFSLGGSAPTISAADLTEWVNSLADDKGTLAQSPALQWAQKTITSFWRLVSKTFS
ncbi:MAG TPA: hypothetical protein VF003_09265, partial [Pseudonocardiaceae bacterium]